LIHKNNILLAVKLNIWVSQSILRYVWSKKKNLSGVLSIQVINKSAGCYTVIKTIGSSSSVFPGAFLLLYASCLPPIRYIRS